MNVGEYIKTLRLQKGMTQEELGEKIGVKRAAVQKWECGSVQNLKRSTIKRLSEIFQVSPSTFISANDDTFSYTELPILTKYNKLNNLGKEKAENYIDDLLENPKYTTSATGIKKESATSVREHLDIAAFGGDGKRATKKKRRTT